MAPIASLTIDNVTSGVIVYQRCLLLKGHTAVPTADAVEDAVSASVSGQNGFVTFPSQTWPLCHGYFKALVILAPGTNKISICSQTDGTKKAEVEVNYTPLLQIPPLHLAILVAKDSPLLIDCPRAKGSGISSTHSDLDAAVAKFRLSAYMWQALIAEDLRCKGLGRRSFRLEEEWALDTLSKDFTSVKHDHTAFGNAMQSTAKVHLVRTEKTVAELRDVQLAQQNENGTRRDELHTIFSQALKAYGGVFQSAACPVVAGLILDSHFSATKNMILGHAALGAHNPNGLSLGIMGSHLTYSWPRFFEEIPSCLLDTTKPGDTVGNDNGECTTMWEACAVGQGAFLHEVGHAFSAPHTAGIMARSYSQHWPKCFLSLTAYSVHKKEDGIAPVTEETKNDATWDLRDALRFSGLPHFKLPTDANYGGAAPPKIELQDDEDFLCLHITSEAGLAGVWLDGKHDTCISIDRHKTTLTFTLEELQARFKRDHALELEVFDRNGKSIHMANAWRLFSSRTMVRIPGTSIRLQKRSVGTGQYDDDLSQGRDKQRRVWDWAVLLKKKTRGGELVRANKIDLRVGCGLDGAVVHYKDGSKMNCGPRFHPGGGAHSMGGHQSKKLALPLDAEITKVLVCGANGTGWGGSLAGLRMHLSTGKAMGALNKSGSNTVSPLEPAADHKIVGFYGQSGVYGMCHEFGIITAPREVGELPMAAYELPELINSDGRGGVKNGKSEKEDTINDDECTTSEDEDCGYDDEEEYSE